MNQLPEQFRALEEFVDMWALPNRVARVRRRLQSTSSEREALYEAGRDLLLPGLAYLDERPLDNLAAQDARLLELLLAMAQVGLAAEQQRGAEVAHARVHARFVLERTSADFGSDSVMPSATA
jgi:hypothetical protein